jgi:hypothetical protein
MGHAESASSNDLVDRIESWIDQATAQPVTPADQVPHPPAVDPDPAADGIPHPPAADPDPADPRPNAADAAA